MIGKSPYHIGPSSIPCRDNPYGAAVAANPHNGRVCLADMDPRQRGLFAAAWSLGLVAAAAKNGIDGIALGAVTGPQGVIYRKADYPQPWFDGGAAAVYPAYLVLAGLAAAGGGKRIEAVSSVSALVAALAHRTKSGQVLWLANLTGERQNVKIGGFNGTARLHMLSEGNFETMTRNARFLDTSGGMLKRVGGIELGPYAVARIAAA
jgi:hypothetical protein